MKKVTLFLLLTIAVQYVRGQAQYLSKTSSVKIFSEAPLENISAANDFANAIIDFETQEIVVKIPIKKFSFRNKLMQTHFNENYLESTLFPYAIFKGFFNKKLDLGKPTNISISANGTVMMHGVSKMEIIEGRILIDPQTKNITLDAELKIKLDDYNIKVPSVVTYKIADNVDVSIQFILTPFS
ncbi:MAG: YceI family protein [Bacteroidota bacterium]|jgi:polyisoprenoid-binding protein YceI